MCINVLDLSFFFFLSLNSSAMGQRVSRSYRSPFCLWSNTLIASRYFCKETMGARIERKQRRLCLRTYSISLIATLRYVLKREREEKREKERERKERECLPHVSFLVSTVFIIRKSTNFKTYYIRSRLAKRRRLHMLSCIVRYNLS